MDNRALFVVSALLSILISNSPSVAQDTGHEAQDAASAPRVQAPSANHEARGGEHGGRNQPKSEFGIFLGATADSGHTNQFSWGFNYKHRIAQRWAVGGLFDYASGSLRNATVAASLTWRPVGTFGLMAAPGIKVHEGRGSSWGCGCGSDSERDEPGEQPMIDPNDSYFVLRFGASWDFRTGKGYGIRPQVSLDLFNGETMWIYGVDFTYAW